MPSTVSEETLRHAAAGYAAGLATLDRRLRELAAEHERLVADRRVTLGAKFAVDRLLESLAGATATPLPEPAAGGGLTEAGAASAIANASAIPLAPATAAAAQAASSTAVPAAPARA